MNMKFTCKSRVANFTCKQTTLFQSMLRKMMFRRISKASRFYKILSAVDFNTVMINKIHQNFFYYLLYIYLESERVV